MIRTTGEQDMQLISVIRDHIDVSLDAGVVIDWVAETFYPEDVFDHPTLEEWALGNGFIREE